VDISIYILYLLVVFTNYYCYYYYALIYYFRDSSTTNNKQIPERISNKEIIEPLSGINYSADKDKHIEHIFDDELNDLTKNENASVAVTEENKLKVSFCMFNPHNLYNLIFFTIIMI